MRTGERRMPLVLATLTTAVIGLTTTGAGLADLPDGPATMEQVEQGRHLVLTSGCTDCHSHGKVDPNDPQWLSGFVQTRDANAGLPFHIGPFTTYPANLTPERTTGLGRFSERRIFNALRWGLDPEEAPDMAITSNVPGQGNFPAVPHYLAPPMPWPSFRHKTDAELWAIVAYLEHGVKPVTNKVHDSEGPPDFWASAYSPGLIGPFPAPSYPAASEAFQP
jgi:hypothetical protein